MIGIVVAMEKEAAPFLKNGYLSADSICGKTFYRITVGGHDAVLSLCGVGKVNASYATALLISRYLPDLILSVGVSGALKNLKILDLMAAVSAVQHDVDTSPVGDEKGFVSTVNTVYFPTDEPTTDIIAEVTGAKKGIIASGEQFVADKKRKREIIKLFDASACDMESAAVAQCAYIAGIKFACVRCMSDSGDGQVPVDYEKFCGEAAEKLYSAVTVVAKSVACKNENIRNLYL